MKKLLKLTGITIALTAIGVAMRAMNKKIDYLDYFTRSNFDNLDDYLKKHIG